MIFLRPSGASKHCEIHKSGGTFGHSFASAPCTRKRHLATCKPHLATRKRHFVTASCTLQLASCTLQLASCTLQLASNTLQVAIYQAVCLRLWLPTKSVRMHLVMISQKEDLLKRPFLKEAESLRIKVFWSADKCIQKFSKKAFEPLQMHLKVFNASERLFFPHAFYFEESGKSLGATARGPQRFSERGHSCTQMQTEQRSSDALENNAKHSLGEL